jgi:hypothetical protein
MATLNDRPDIRVEISERKADFLSKREFPRVYGQLRGWCHLANPFGRQRDWEAARVRLIEIRTSLLNLLDWHTIVVLDDPRLHLVRMSDPTDRVAWMPLTRIADLPDDVT